MVRSVVGDETQIEARVDALFASRRTAQVLCLCFCLSLSLSFQSLCMQSVHDHDLRDAFPLLSSAWYIVFRA
jgi:hypothetical protein